MKHSILVVVCWSLFPFGYQAPDIPPPPVEELLFPVVAILRREDLENKRENYNQHIAYVFNSYESMGMIISTEWVASTLYSMKRRNKQNKSWNPVDLVVYYYNQTQNQITGEHLKDVEDSFMTVKEVVMNPKFDFSPTTWSVEDGFFVRVNGKFTKGMAAPVQPFRIPRDQLDSATLIFFYYVHWGSNAISDKDDSSLYMIQYFGPVRLISKTIELDKSMGACTKYSGDIDKYLYCGKTALNPKIILQLDSMHPFGALLFRNHRVIAYSIEGNRRANLFFSIATQEETPWMEQAEKLVKVPLPPTPPRVKKITKTTPGTYREKYEFRKTSTADGGGGNADELAYLKRDLIRDLFEEDGKGGGIHGSDGDRETDGDNGNNDKFRKDGRKGMNDIDNDDFLRGGIRLIGDDGTNGRDGKDGVDGRDGNDDDLYGINGKRSHWRVINGKLRYDYFSTETSPLPRAYLAWDYEDCGVARGNAFTPLDFHSILTFASVIFVSIKLVEMY